MRSLVKPLAIAALLGAASLSVSAVGPATENSIARMAKDKSLQWGGCPPFMPQGCAVAVLHGDPAKPNVDVFFKVPAGAKIPAHTHTSAERMVLVSGELTVKYDGEKAVTLTKGSYAYGPAGKAHEGSCAKGEDCVLFIAFESPLDAHEYKQPLK